MEFVSGSRLGPYEIVSPLGAGGMGVVYKARDHRLDRFVAIKVLGPAALADSYHQRRFAQEAKAASALNHPGIITIYEISSANGIDFIAMEYVDGVTLDRLITRTGLEIRKALDYASAAAGTLAKAHAAGIIHRDLKPSNIIVADDGTVKILDFGLAKLTSSGRAEPGDRQSSVTETRTQSDEHLTEPGRVMGTIAYMSPEQAEGKRIDHRSDIFSFGVLLYEMLTGRRPFQGNSSASMLAALLTIDPVPPGKIEPAVPRDLERLVLRCLRRDPAKRIQSAGDLALELDEIRSDLSSRPALLRRRPASSFRVLAAAALLAAVAVAVWFFRPSSLDSVAEPVSRLVTAYPGIETAPTFSPDGTQLAFVWDGEQRNNPDIYVTQVGSGGTPLRLTSDPAPDLGPTWSPDGTQIAFVRGSNQGSALFVTSPLGGGERKIVQLSLLPSQLSWTRDSRHLIGDMSTSDDADHLEWITVGSGDARVIATGNDSGGRHLYPAISPKGDYLAYGYGTGPTGVGTSVFIVPLGPDFTPVGPARALTKSSQTLRGITWAADGASLIYAAGVNGEMWRVTTDGAAPKRILPGVQGFLPVVARAGHRLAYARSSANADLWKFEAGAAPVVFASSNTHDYDPSFSPDGTQIAFASGRSGDLAIWRAKADGSAPVQLTFDHGKRPGSPRWSPDGKWLAFDNQLDDGHSRIFVVDAAGGRPRRLTELDDDEAFPSWSPDGQWIYYRSSRTKRNEVWRAKVAGGEPTQVTRTGGSTPFVSADGESVYYLRGAGVLRDLFVAPVAGGPERRLLQGIRQWDYLPTKRGIYYVSVVSAENPATQELRVFDLATSEHRVLARFESSGSYAGLAVSPDGNTVLKASMSLDDGMDLMMVDNFR